MSTRSGKRIHVSFHENTLKSESDFTRSERKTRSKHAKENFDELNGSSIKVKKRNYVAYPADDLGVDTVDHKNEEKTTRTLRKNALKERNVTSAETVEPAIDTRKSVRSTRRTRKFEEDSQDTPADAPHGDELTKADLTKPKKVKKKKKTEQEQVVEVTVAVPKKKSKKKRDRRSSSLVVEDITAPSNMSIDSFHSAADSPRNCNTDFNNSNTVLEHNDSNKTEARRTRSSLKLDLTSEDVTEKEWKKRKSSVKGKSDSSLRDAIFEKDNHDSDNPFNGELKKRKTSVNYDAIENVKDTKNSTFESNTPRTSLKNSTFNMVETPTKINTTFEKDVPNVVSSQKIKKKSVVNDVDEDVKSSENIEDTCFEKESVAEHTNKKRKSTINALIEVGEKFSPLKSADKSKRKSKAHEVVSSNNDEHETITDSTFNTTVKSPFKASLMKLTIEESKRNSSVNTTFNKDSETDSDKETKKSIVDETFDITSSPFKSANEVSSPFKITDENDKRKSVINTTYEKDDAYKDNKKSTDLLITADNNTETNTTFEIDSNKNKKTSLIEQKRKSLQQLSMQNITNTNINCLIDVQQNKLDSTFDKSAKSSLISSDNSMITLDKSDASRISITSDESKTEENILNTTPILIWSSMDESQINTTKTPTKEISPLKTELAPPVTHLKREGTFTKDEPEVISSPKPKTPTKRMSLPSPGFTPFHVNKSSSKEKSMLNVTRSIEKRRSSLAEPARTTRVMFCSPVNNPAVVTQNRRKVIKSNLKGSNKSFVFDDSVSLESRPATRKRSYTQSDADDARVKRKRLADELQQSVDRLSRPRTSSASAKLAEPTTPSKKPTTPSKCNAKLPRTKLPNFAVLHQKRFAKMESLDECQERKAKRAKQLLTPTGAVNMLDRISPKDKDVVDTQKSKKAEKSKEVPNKPETPIKSLPTFKSLNPGYTRFGFKLNLDVNPFSIPSKVQPKPKENKPNGLRREPTLPSLAGATSIRREVAKQTVMREKSFTDRRSVKRTENRTVIKGVRTNRRFELQMQMRHM